MRDLCISFPFYLCYNSVMRKTFKTPPELFVASAELDHPSLHGLDGAEAVQTCSMKL